MMTRTAATSWAEQAPVDGGEEQRSVDALTAVEGVRLAADELTGLDRRHVPVQTVTSHNLDCPPLLAGVHDHYPRCRSPRPRANADQLLDGLRMGRLEGAIISVGGATRPASRSKSSATKPLVAAVSHDHELAVHPVISLDTLSTVHSCLPPARIRAADRTPAGCPPHRRAVSPPG